MAAYEAQLRADAQLDRVEDARRAQRALERQLDVYREQFPPIEKPVAEMQRIDAGAAVLAAQQEAAARISRLRFGRRRAAREAAAVTARAQADIDQQEAIRAQAQRQAEIDMVWQRLVDNDPEVVLQALEEAFEDNEVSAAPIDCEGSSVFVLLRCPVLDGMVPTHRPVETPSGSGRVRAYAKTRRNELYLAALLGHGYATVAETFAIAPGISDVTLLTVSVGAGELTPVYCAHVTRDEFRGGGWLHDGAPCLAPRHLVNLLGRTAEVWALDLAAEPQLSDVVRRIAKDLGVTVSERTNLAAPSGPAVS
ncbi:MAG TPA: hypothetical protein VHX62_01440 [Solirubrobacteraceae bacterium]|nr:hypothetical protein [Solirubrobacteraceae bacterium]